MGASGYDDALTLAYDPASGKKRWANRYDGPSHLDDGGEAIELSSDGTGLFATGYRDGASTDTDLLAISYDPATGKRRWVSVFDGPAHGVDDAFSIALNPAGSSVYAVGEGHWNAVRSDLITVAFDSASGERQWVSHYDDPSHLSDWTYYDSAAVSPDGANVYVVGNDAEHGGDIVTVGYDAVTGAELWNERYDDGDGGYDFPVAIAANPDGSAVYVAGQSFKRGHNFDIITIAYAS
jgi:DNA-binding beta-propeller fold protein YncE